MAMRPSCVPPSPPSSLSAPPSSSHRDPRTPPALSAPGAAQGKIQSKKAALARKRKRFIRVRGTERLVQSLGALVGGRAVPQFSFFFVLGVFVRCLRIIIAGNFKNVEVSFNDKIVNLEDYANINQVSCIVLPSGDCSDFRTADN